LIFQIKKTYFDDRFFSAAAGTPCTPKRILVLVWYFWVSCIFTYFVYCYWPAYA